MAKNPNNLSTRPTAGPTQCKRTESDTPPSLPTSGRGRWNDIAPFVGVSRETWRQMVNAGKAPAPLRITERCTLYDFAAVHTWIANPVDYRAGGDQ